MALLFYEGFEHLDGMSTGGWTNTGVFGMAVSTDDPRYADGLSTRYCASGYASGGFKNFEKVSTVSSGGYLYVGLANKRNISGYWFLIRDIAGSTNIVRLEAGDPVTVYIGNTNVGSFSTTVSPFTWSYFEIDLYIHDTAGQITVRQNGYEVFQSTATYDSNLAQAGRFYIGGTGSGGYNRLDDIYVADSTGSTCNTSLGNARIIARDVNAAGSSAQWTPVGDSPNYACVDDPNTHDIDSTYVTSNSLTDKDLYNITNTTGLSGIVHAVGVNLIGRTPVGSRKLLPRMKLSTNESTGVTGAFLNSSYLRYRDWFETKPGGGTWSMSDVDNLEVGMSIEAL